MQTVVLNIDESVSKKLEHFDTILEALIDKGLESKVSPLTHKEVFDGFRAKYAKKG